MLRDGDGEAASGSAAAQRQAPAAQARVLYKTGAIVAISYNPPGRDSPTIPLDRQGRSPYPVARLAGMVKRYHESFPSFSYGFDSRYPLQRFSFAAWQDALANRRCLIPALGYFEWMQADGRKPLYFITVRQNAPLIWFAGLRCAAGRGCVILTRAPSPQIEHIHGRMPVIVAPGEMAGWLDGGMDTATAQSSLGTGWEGRFDWHEVAPLRRDATGPSVIAPHTPPQASFDF